MKPGEAVLVTGADGFVGSRLTEYLVRRGFRVRGAVRREREVAGPAQERFNVGHINGQTRWEDALAGVSSVVHLAARVHVMKENVDDPATAFEEVNTRGTIRLAESAAASGVRRLVYISTVKVNGESTPLDRGFSEDDPVNPLDPYAVSKWKGEEGIRETAGRSGMEVVIIRPPLVIGPRVKGNFLRMMNWVHRGVPLPLAWVRNQRTMLGLTNLVDFIGLCLTHPDAAGQTFLVGDAEPLSTPELICQVARAMGRRPRLFPLPLVVLRTMGAAAGLGPALDRLCGSLVLNTNKARIRLGWSPVRVTSEELEDTVNQYLADAV